MVNSPKTAYNFYCLCTGSRGIGEVTGATLAYKKCGMHRIIKEMCIQGGDIQFNNGFGGESIYGGEFDDENLTMKHDTEGIVSMGNSGPNTNTSQFFITVAPCPHLDGQNCVFGRVISGMDAIKRLSQVSVDEDDCPTTPCIISDCGKSKS